MCDGVRFAPLAGKGFGNREGLQRGREINPGEGCVRASLDMMRMSHQPAQELGKVMTRGKDWLMRAEGSGKMNQGGSIDPNRQTGDRRRSPRIIAEQIY